MARVLKELLSSFFSHFGCCFIWWFSWSWIRWGSRQSLNQLSVPTTSQSHVLGLVCQVAGRAKSVNVDDAEKKWISCPDPDVIQTFYWATVCCLSGCWMLASVLRRQTSMDIVSPHFDSIQRHGLFSREGVWILKRNFSDTSAFPEPCTHTQTQQCQHIFFN